LSTSPLVVPVVGYITLPRLLIFSVRPSTSTSTSSDCCSAMSIRRGEVVGGQVRADPAVRRLAQPLRRGEAQGRDVHDELGTPPHGAGGVHRGHLVGERARVGYQRLEPAEQALPFL